MIMSMKQLPLEFFKSVALFCVTPGTCFQTKTRIYQRTNGFFSASESFLHLPGESVQDISRVILCNERQMIMNERNS